MATPVNSRRIIRSTNNTRPVRVEILCHDGYGKWSVVKRSRVMERVKATSYVRRELKNTTSETRYRLIAAATKKKAISMGRVVVTVIDMTDTNDGVTVEVHFRDSDKESVIQRVIGKRTEDHGYGFGGMDLFYDFKTVQSADTFVARAVSRLRQEGFSATERRIS